MGFLETIRQERTLEVQKLNIKSGDYVRLQGDSPHVWRCVNSVFESAISTYDKTGKSVYNFMHTIVNHTTNVCLINGHFLLFEKSGITHLDVDLKK